VKPGWGIAARLLADAGIEVMDEEHLQASLYL
jgi:methylmalonyl-CoA mutase cobalamin-binding subunit